jgi:hypothetical protein
MSRYRWPWQVPLGPFSRYVRPAELDLMAQLAGLRLREGWNGWTREPFTSESHVSIRQKPTGSHRSLAPAKSLQQGRLRSAFAATPQRG